jgi:hypothetical protein
LNTGLPEFSAIANSRAGPSSCATLRRSAYVVLAEALGCSLLTRDRRLARSSGHLVPIEVAEPRLLDMLPYHELLADDPRGVCHGRFWPARGWALSGRVRSQAALTLCLVVHDDTAQWWYKVVP